MTSYPALAAILLSCGSLANAQGRPLDWPNYGGDAQRTGWEKSDSRITKENVKDFRMVLKQKLDNGRGGPYSLTPPVVIGNLISYRGFKELAFVAGSSGKIWSIDADLERMFWQKQVGTPSNGSQAGCSDRVSAIPALTPPLNFSAGRPRAAAAGTAPARPPGRSGGTAFGSPRPVFVLAADGKIHQLNSSTGKDEFPPLDFLPPNAKASSLTLHDGVLYTTTSSDCGGAPAGVWAIGLDQTDPKPVSYLLKEGTTGGLGGFALGADGTVFVQTQAGNLGTLIALTPKDLTLKQSFSGPAFATPGSGAPGGSVTPVVFAWKGREMVVSGGKNGSLYLLDGQSLGGDDHKTPLYQTAPLSAGGVWGGLSSWQDTDGTRWVLAPVWGALNSDLKSLLTSGDAPNGSIVAFKVEERQGKPALTPAWVSRDMSSPEPPVITSGVVFALSAGERAHAILYALDGATGKEMYSTAGQVTAPGNLTGLTVANGRVYFTTTDGTLYAFGIFLER
ncbi:MAG: PQQ-binding-like beta-propeller repeat protein [Acidobacteriota bacterium]|nr:PQQ-binding-like beta-propeller repeat protein [Acidobacteriota bacterium]